MRSHLLLTVLLSSAAPSQSDKLDANIPAGERTAAVFIRMTEQIVKTGPDFVAYCKQHNDVKRRPHRVAVIKTLKTKSDASWKIIEKVVDSLGDGVQNVERYWIVNGFACMASGNACRTLAKHPAVSFVYRKPRRVPPLHKRSGNPRARKNLAKRNDALANQALTELKKAEQDTFPAFDKLAPPWNVKRIKAVDAWKTGAFGQGVTIALLDSGLLVTPALARALWRNPKEELNGKDDDGNGYVDDLFGYDFRSNTGISIDDPGFPCHGSICGGIIAGRPIEVDGKFLVTGVAPKSRLMVIRGMGLIKAYEYAVDNGADIVSMSYMWIGIQLGNWRGLYRLAHEHMTLAGIVSVGGSGNFATNAPKGKQIALPKDIPCVICASGLNKANVMPRFSSLGPCSWDGVKFYDDYPENEPLAKPDVTAFITGYPMWSSTQMPRRVRWKVAYEASNNIGLVVGPQGNSFSGPHAGAVAALMFSANPDLPAWRVKELMEATCRDLGDKGRDYKFGAGMIDAAKAVAAAREAK